MSAENDLNNLFDDLDFDDLGQHRLLTPDDIVRVARIDSPIAAPSGDWIAFTRSRTGGDLSKTTSILIVQTKSDAKGHHKIVQLTRFDG